MDWVNDLRKGVDYSKPIITNKISFRRLHKDKRTSEGPVISSRSSLISSAGCLSGNRTDIKRSVFTQREFPEISCFSHNCIKLRI